MTCPSGIRLRQQEFLIDETLIVKEDSDNDYAQNLEDICIALGTTGIKQTASGTMQGTA